MVESWPVKTEPEIDRFVGFQNAHGAGVDVKVQIKVRRP
jgi:hypothetical protein